MSIRLIAIDIDGTLMPSSGLLISRRNREALCAAEAAGIEIVIATGRRQAYAMPLVSQLGLNHDSVMVSSNGAVIRRFDGHLIGRRYLSAAASRRLCRELGGYGSLVFTFDRDGAGSLIIEDIQQLRARIEKWVDANRPYLTEVHPLERAFDGEELPIQGMVCGAVEEMQRAEEALRASGMGREISMHRTEYALRGLSILDLLPLGCSKGTALDRLAGIWNLERSEIMAIGDNLNDLEMLDYAGRAVVMGNASGEMLALARARGWEVTAANDEDGVAQAVESVLGQSPAIPRISLKSLGGNSGTAQEVLFEPPGSNPADADIEDTMIEWLQ